MPAMPPRWKSSLLVPPDGLPEPKDSCGVGFVANISGEKSSRILQVALSCVCALSHRGAMDADAKTGDGAGVLTQIPHDLFRKEVEALGYRLYQDEDLGVGFCFLPPHDAYVQAHCRKLIAQAIERRGLFLFGWRKVPVRRHVLGDKALATCPEMEQVLIGRPEDGVDTDEYERRLYLCRREIEQRAQEEGLTELYLPSFSSRTLVYKGLMVSPQLDKFYCDLRDPAYKTALAIYHQRYSTNTFPSWALAQPFRMVAHNGEINTILGNRLWTMARESQLEATRWGDESRWLRPILQGGGSDSAHVDNVVELLTLSGRELPHAVLMMVPPAWQAEVDLSGEERGFYEYHEAIMEAWDGPAALVWSDGRFVGACLDRNGLRPARFKITVDGMVLLGSEVGIGGVDPEEVIESGRLGPGEILAIDCHTGRLWRSRELKERYARRRPYASWVQSQQRKLKSQASLGEEGITTGDLVTEQLAFGYNEEELKLILKPMAEKGEEPVGSMGDDAPLAVLSSQPRLLYWYFRQLFAQVTNPPIDPIREKLVMSLSMRCGCRANWLEEGPEHARLLYLAGPLLTNAELAEIKQWDEPGFRSQVLSCLFPVSEGPKGLRHRLEALRKEAEKAVRAGTTFLILSDRGVTADEAPIPMLLAVGAIHHHLIRAGLRMEASLLCETGECWDVHHFACLIGFGASAVNPYLALATLVDLYQKGQLSVSNRESLLRNYRNALEKGLLKILSKMGISTLESYHGAQIFEAVGIHPEVVEECFRGVASQIGGLHYEDIAVETLRRHKNAFGETKKLPDPGVYRYRREGERHAITPPVLQALHTFLGFKGEDKAGRWEDYLRYSQAISESRPLSLRHCLAIRPGKPIPLEEVEPVEEIRKRFTTAGMSLGALSPEAHETLAIAMNRIGAKSNSGEGGEARARFFPLENGDSKNSAIKQVASGRFGVTAEYLASAEEIEIKMAQGSKPGEGGQLPGHKVNALIARLRHSTPGVALISPPPHHDIYSIEDLAQLIYDLKQVNPRARVCVKLVSEAGVGTIAAGVAKAHADVILISGHDGGTGASPLSSIKYAGTPWELGLAETQYVLLANGLRERVTLRVDGGIRTGWDIVLAAILGAEEFNFGTMALIALGCVYVRQCHLNTCPTGIATQDEKLRAKFRGKPEGVIRYVTAVAEEVRQILASMGVRTLNEIIGRTEWLEQQMIPGHPKANTLELKRLLVTAPVDETVPRYHTWERNNRKEDRPLDDVILQDAKTALQTQRPIRLEYRVQNTQRSIGTKLSGEIAFRYGDQGLPEGTIQLYLVGSAGQSLGAFLVQGVEIVLEGEANDYVGKGMSGGRIVLRPWNNSPFVPEENWICGNTVLYGATGGSFFARGRAGERFAVRNSGAIAVIEGIGDHGCEYMTGGTVVVLGRTGKNFAAGMTGGIAYVLDEEETFPARCNRDTVGLERIAGEEEGKRLAGLVYQHLEYTESATARRILKEWDRYLPLFWKVVPHPPAAVGQPQVEVAKARP